MDAADIRRVVAESVALKEHFFAESAELLLEVGAKMAESLSRGGRVLVFGNGGSAADAQHLSGELVGHFRNERPGLAALALSTDTSVLTAIANDYDFGAVFARQLDGMAKGGDVLLAMTTSGSSPNVLEAVEKARALEMKTIGMTGSRGSSFAGRCHLGLVVPSDDVARIQEAHICAGHLICQLVEAALFGNPDR